MRLICICVVIKQELDSMDGDPKWVDVIERDLHRQFPFHEMFVSRGGHGLVYTISYTYICMHF